MSRPAETAGGGAAAGIVAAYFLGVHDPSVVAALGVVAGLVPALVTGLVELVRRRG